MLGFLKKKLSKAIEGITKRAEVKEKAAEELSKPGVKEEIKQAIETVEPQVKTEAVPEETVKQVEEAVHEKLSEPKVSEPSIEAVEHAIEEEMPKTPEPQEVKIDVVPKLETVEAEVIVEKPKKSLFKKLAEKVVKKVTEKKLELEDVQPILQELETGLIESDVAVEVSEKITGDLKNALVGGEIKRGKEKEAVTDALRKSLLGILSVPEINLEDATREKKPFVILFLGFNGAGKTTTIAKVGKWLMDKGHTVVFAAGDTWRKAAIEQLEEHGKALNVNVIKHTYGADPAAVIYDGIEHAKARGIDVLLADSAGRTHVNQNLINELKKVVRVAKPDLKVLVMDSLVGNDAVEQAKMFNEAVGVDAVVFTKLDVNQKGGAILSVTHLLKKPVLFLGTGQEYEKLIKFDSTKFVDELLI